MSFLLDSDVLSQTAKPVPNQRVMNWLLKNDARLMYASVISIAEVKAGVSALPLSARRTDLTTWLNRRLLPHYAGRILPVTLPIASDYGELVAVTKLSGFTADPLDVLIASTARVHRLSLVTLNRRHFSRLGVTLANLSD